MKRSEEERKKMEDGSKEEKEIGRTIEERDGGTMDRRKNEGTI